MDKFGIGVNAKKISSGALRRLQEYLWPGNVRELENVIHSLTILSSDEVISIEHLPHWMNKQVITQPTSKPNVSNEEMLQLPTDLSAITLRDFVKVAERLYIEKALNHNSGDKTKTAQTLKMGRTTLYGKLRELDLLN